MELLSGFVLWKSLKKWQNNLKLKFEVFVFTGFIANFFSCKYGFIYLIIETKW